jgi:hypothetical protein
MSQHTCPPAILSSLSCLLSCSDSPVYLFCPSSPVPYARPSCHVLAVKSLMSCSGNPVLSVCSVQADFSGQFVQADLPQLSCLDILPRLSCPGCPVTVVLSRLSFPGCTVSAGVPFLVMFWPPPSVLSRLTCARLTCPANMSRLKTGLVWLFCRCCPVPAVIPTLSCHDCLGCPVLNVLSQLSCPIMFSPLSSLSCHGCPATLVFPTLIFRCFFPAVLSQMPSSYVPAILGCFT